MYDHTKLEAVREQVYEGNTAARMISTLSRMSISHLMECSSDRRDTIFEDDIHLVLELMDKLSTGLADELNSVEIKINRLKSAA